MFKGAGYIFKYVIISRTDQENNRIIYTQDFPQKHLNGHYDFKASVLGNNIHTKGQFNISLYDYT